MKIERIKVYNIGPYVDTNSFDFNVNDKTKRMVLIGGKNGSGKTTLFNAIKICLYGCVAFGFGSNNATYFDEVRKIINTNEKLKKVGQASVEIKLLFDDGKYNNEYTFNRSWKVSGKKFSEDFILQKNGEVLSETEKSDFESFLLQLLPPNLFKFYFFDGEKISDFVFNSNKNSDFKEAFLKLCNLDTMEIICDNFKRISKVKTKDGADISEEYNKWLKEDNLKRQRIEYAEEEYQAVSAEIEDIDDQLANLEKKYAKSGGISKKDWRAMQNQIAKEEAKRDEIRKWLKDIANNVLPFIIMRSELVELKNQISLEHKAQVDANVKNTIDTPEIKSIIFNVLNGAGVDLSDAITKKIVSEIISYTDITSKITPILNLSEFDKFELISKINSMIAFDTGRIKTATTEINASLNCVKRIRKKIERSSVENYEEFLQAKNDLNEKKIAKTQRLLEIDKELQDLRAQKAITSARLSKAKSNYEAILKKQSINDISARALLAFGELQKNLYDKSIRLVQEEFEKSFNSLINKSDLIDGIYIDNNLNVLPYKKKMFKVCDLEKTINKNGQEYVIAQIGLHAYEVFCENLNSGFDKIELPVEVKQQLSAGERQIFIMSIYQALSKLNKIDVPYIIDTPFSRIDKEHRGKILDKFFKKLNGQIIILSTDEEIVGEYYNSTKSILSSTFLLNHKNDGSTTILANTYFGD